MDFLFWLAIIILFLTIAISVEIGLGMRRLTNIKDVPSIQQEDTPKVSIIIPACNEATTIEPALRSVLALDYTNVEVIVVNDRSTDKTSFVIEQIQKAYPDLQVYEVAELPKGWLGKSHALQYGAEQAQGEYLLFTDADIIMEKTTLSRAMHHMLNNKLDHMSMFWESVSQGGLLNALFMDVGGGLLLLLKPWKAKDKNSKRYMGVGAFNLVKTTAYRAIDGHSAFSMHPVDDIMLGKVLKQHGFSQDCLFGQSFLQVKWYSTVCDFINGCMKNAFALCDYSLVNVSLGVLMVLILNVLPFWAFFFTFGITRGLFGAVIIIRMLSAMSGLLKMGFPLWYSVWVLVTPYINIYIVVKAAIITTRNKGITWRGTYYPLDELKTKQT